MKQLARASKKVKDGKHVQGVLDWSYKHYAEKPQPVSHALSGDLLWFKSSKQQAPHTHSLPLRGVRERFGRVNLGKLMD